MKQLSKSKLREIRGGGNALSGFIQAARNGDGPIGSSWVTGNKQNVELVRSGATGVIGPANGVGAWVSSTAQS